MRLGPALLGAWLLGGALPSWAAPSDAPDPSAEPVCAPAALASLKAPQDRLAVAWVGRWSRQPRGWIHVVPTAELRTWLSTQEPTYTGRTLQHLGLRRRNADPRRRYKVIVFDVDAGDLCRPVTDMEGALALLPACAPRLSRPTRGRTGCGTTIDRRTGAPGASLFAVRRREAEARGHCEVPLERYLKEVGR